MRRASPTRFVCLAAALVLAAGCGKKNDTVKQAEKQDAASGVPAPGIEEVKKIAEDGFVYGLPVVMNYAIQYDFVIDKNSGQWKAPFNQINNEHRVFTDEDTSVPTPNSDTPYSMLWLDLRAEPMVISVPAVEKTRYYSVQLCDGNTYNYGYIGNRATGNEAGDYLVAGPHWQGDTPAGIKKVFHSSTDLGLTIFRTQLFGPGDMPNVERVQAGYKVQPLSAFLKQPAPAAAPDVQWPKIDKDLVKTEFFEYLDFALQFAPPQENEKEIRARLATIGVGPGKKFDFKQLSAEHKAAILIGMKEGSKKVDEAAAAAGKRVNGWQVSGLPGDSAHYNGDWLKRAAAAKAGIYGNSPEEAMYPFTRNDGTGQELDGSKHAYTLTFPKGQLPPVSSFWSVTMYDGKTQLLIKNPINRYLLNSPMLSRMKKNADGSVTLYVRKDSPGKDKESNWLPAPDGPIYMVMRLYWPKTEPPSILPPGEGTWPPPALVAAK
jgi:hypothetical protein